MVLNNKGAKVDHYKAHGSNKRVGMAKNATQDWSRTHIGPSQCELVKDAALTSSQYLL